MNIKGFVFLICTIFVLFLAINYSVNANHFLISHQTNANFEGSLMLKNNFIAKKDTLIYIQSFKQSPYVDLELTIEGENEIVYSNREGIQEKPKKINLAKGMFSFTIRGENGDGSNFNTLIGYYTDEIVFLNDEEGDQD